MTEEFFWLRPRNLCGIVSALKQAKTLSEREQLKKLMYRGITEWTFIVAFFSALFLGVLAIDDGANMLVASIAN